jgi:hypothetical protein
VAEDTFPIAQPGITQLVSDAPRRRWRRFGGERPESPKRSEGFSKKLLPSFPSSSRQLKLRLPSEAWEADHDEGGPPCKIQSM